MTQSIVEMLEVIEVDEEDCEGGMSSGRPVLDAFLQLKLDGMPIKEAR